MRKNKTKNCEKSCVINGMKYFKNSSRLLLHSDAIEVIMLNVENLNLTVHQLERLPLGTIISWNQLDVESHTPNWVECDGRPILSILYLIYPYQFPQ